VVHVCPSSNISCGVHAASASEEQVQEREQSPVHILPETLVSGAMSVAAKAFSSAEAIMRSIQSPRSSIASFSVR
jgi:hypothetical protein